jgi:hypothetical protein
VAIARSCGVAAWLAASPISGCDARSAGSAACQRDVRAEARPAAVDDDLAEPRELADADEPARRLEPLLEAIEQIDAAGERHRAGLGERGDRVVDGFGLDPLEALHDFLVFSAASTVRGVIGSSRMRTPIAL